MIVQFIVLIILIMNDLLSNLSRIYIQNKVSSEVIFNRKQKEKENCKL